LLLRTKEIPMNFRETKIPGKLTITALAAFGVGALTMFLFDPVAGRRRRALVRDKTVSTANDAIDAASSKVRDLKNRAKGLAHEAADTTAQVIPWSGPERRVPPRGTEAQRHTGVQR
jgi:hypothetical protein